MNKEEEPDNVSVGSRATYSRILASAANTNVAASAKEKYSKEF